MLGALTAPRKKRATIWNDDNKTMVTTDMDDSDLDLLTGNREQPTVPVLEYSVQLST